MTPDGAFTSTRVLHATPNAVTHLQSILAEIFPVQLKEHALYWMDDYFATSQYGFWSTRVRAHTFKFVPIGAYTFTWRNVFNFQRIPDGAVLSFPQKESGTILNS